MRPLLVVAILLVGLRSAAPEAKFQDALPDPDTIYASLNPEAVCRQSRSRVRSRNLPRSNPPTPRTTRVNKQPPRLPRRRPAPTQAPMPSSSDSLEGLCKALMTSAQDYQLPVPFFANLIWQESRLQHDAVSKVGAQGIAQFMPEVAAEEGVGDPFDPRQAIPASARLLHALAPAFRQSRTCGRRLQCRRRTASASGSIATAHCRRDAQSMSCASPAAPSKRGENRRSTIPSSLSSGCCLAASYRPSPSWSRPNCRKRR